MRVSNNKIIIGLLTSGLLMTDAVNCLHASDSGYGSQNPNDVYESHLVDDCDDGHWPKLRPIHKYHDSSSPWFDELGNAMNYRISIIVGKLFSLDEDGNPLNLSDPNQLQQFSEFFDQYKVCEVVDSTRDYIIPFSARDKYPSLEQKLAIISYSLNRIGNEYCSFVVEGELTSQHGYRKSWLSQSEDDSLRLIARRTNRDVYLITVHDGKIFNPYFIKGIKRALTDGGTVEILDEGEADLENVKVESTQLGFNSYHDDRIIRLFHDYGCKDNMFELDSNNRETNMGNFLAFSHDKHSEDENSKRGSIVLIKDETDNRLYLLFKSEEYPQTLQIFEDLYNLMRGFLNRHKGSIISTAVLSSLVAGGYLLWNRYSDSSNLEEDSSDYLDFNGGAYGDKPLIFHSDDPIL